MPETEARFVDGRLSSGQVRAIAANVSPRLVPLYQAVEAELLDIVTPLTPTDAATAMAGWAIRAHALVDADDDAPAREDEFFHSKTLGDRYVTKGGFGALTGAMIASALKLAEADNPRDGDTRSPAQRRGEALADVCGFYVDYRTRTDADPDAPSPPKKRNWPQLITVTSDDKLFHRDGGQILDGPAHRPHRRRSPVVHRAAAAAGVGRRWCDSSLRTVAGVDHRRPLRRRRGA